MSVLFEATSSLAYSLLGLVIGFALGRATREVHEIKEAVAPDPHPAHEKPPTRKQGRMSYVKSRTIGVMLIGLALVTVLMTSIVAIEDRRQNECFRNYNIAFAKAFQERALAADRDRISLNRMLIALNNPNAEVRRKVFENYLDEIALTDLERKKNPLPRPPDPARFCE